jgi:hypothetical protein
MIDTLTHIDSQDYDDYNRRNIGRRRRNLNRRRPPVRHGNLGFPVKVKFPTKKQPKIVKGMPNKAVKLPPIKPTPIKNTGVIKPKTKSTTTKPIWIKRGGKAVKTKVSIDKLVSKTNSKNKMVDKTVAKNTKAAKQANLAEEPISNSGKKKGANSDSRVGKIIKVVAGIAILGFTGYGIYRYIQYRKKKGANPIKKVS